MVCASVCVCVCVCVCARACFFVRLFVCLFLCFACMHLSVANLFALLYLHVICTNLQACVRFNLTAGRMSRRTFVPTLWPRDMNTLTSPVSRFDAQSQRGLVVLHVGRTALTRACCALCHMKSHPFFSFFLLLFPFLALPFLTLPSLAFSCRVLGTFSTRRGVKEDTGTMLCHTARSCTSCKTTLALRSGRQRTRGWPL